jgi:hypothetical protein
MGEFKIFDWAGNSPFGEKLFRSFDDAEEFLSEFLGDQYETDRQEYYILPKRGA